MKHYNNHILAAVAVLLLAISCMCGVAYAAVSEQQRAIIDMEGLLEVGNYKTPLGSDDNKTAGKSQSNVTADEENDNKSVYASTSAESKIITVRTNQSDLMSVSDNGYINLSAYKLWESGEYDSYTGAPAENRRRLRYPKYIVPTGKKYYIALSEGLRINIIEYSPKLELIKTVTCSDGDTYKPSKKAAFITVTLYRNYLEKQLSPGQWNRLFDEGLNIVMATEEWKGTDAKDAQLFNSGEMVSDVNETADNKTDNKSAANNSGKVTEVRTETQVDITSKDILRATGKGFYINLSFFGLWESGEYSSSDGTKIENKRRLRYDRYIVPTENEYQIILSDNLRIRISEYSSSNKLVNTITCADGYIYRPSENTAYFTLTLMREDIEKQLSPGQWNALFEKGLTVIVCTEEWRNYTIADEGNLISGSDSKTLTDNEYTDLLLAGKDNELAQRMWYDQILTGQYTLTGEELDNGRVTYFFSSSEGDDGNSGLSMDCPKKSFECFSGISNANLLLKCGDVFEMEDGFSLGSNCTMAAYGEGDRPVISYYRNLELKFTECPDYENLWVADMSGMDIYTGQDNKDNCNIGQLIVNGEINWKRYVWSSKYPFDSTVLMDRADNGWAVDWTNSELYWYSEINPNTLDVIYAPPVTAISLSGSKNILIKGIEIVGAGRHACNMTNCHDITVSCCYFHEIGGSVHRNSGSRYGNAFQIWDSGTDITISNNYVAWIFDTCFTHQGNNTDSQVENVFFDHNIGAHFYWGIEVWGGFYCNNGYHNVNYTNNVLYDNIDVTNPYEAVYSKANTRVVFSDPNMTLDDYISYRNGYYYHQMSSINVNNSGDGEFTNIADNIVWNSHRFLVLGNDSRNEGDHFTGLTNNILFATVDVPVACLLRMTKADNTKEYCQYMKYIDASNKWEVHDISENYDSTAEKAALERLLREISGRNK